MFEKKHVGRPSNEELKQRKRRKILKVSVPIVSILFLIGIITLIMTGSLSQIMGNSVVKEYYSCENGYQLKGNKCYMHSEFDARILGDVDENGSVSVADVTKIQRYISDIAAMQSGDEKAPDFTDFDYAAADVNKDGNVDNEDVVEIQRSISVNNTTTHSTVSSYNDKIGVEKVCARDYKLSGNTCSRTIVIDAQKKIDDSVKKYTCPSGYQLKRNKCYMHSEFDARILGDVDENGSVSVADVTKIQRYISDIAAMQSGDEKVPDFTDFDYAAADVNKDGNVDNEDVVEIQRSISVNNTTTHSTVSSYNDKIGVEKVCARDYKLSGNTCSRMIVIDVEQK